MRGLKLGKDTDIKKVRATALKEAAIADKPKIIESLYDSISEVDDDDFLPAFHAACKNGSGAVLRCLVTNSCGKGLSNEHYCESFKAAVMNGQKEVVRYLLDQCPEKCIPGNRDELFVKYACKGYLEIVKHLDPEARNHVSYHSVRDQALSEACAGGHEDVVEFLIHAGAGVNALVQRTSSLSIGDDDGPDLYGPHKGCKHEWPRTALLASLQGIPESGHNGVPGTGSLKRFREDRDKVVAKREAVMGRLLANDADVNLVAGSNMTPLHSAALNCTEAMVRAMIDAGADIHSNAFEGATPLQCAASREVGSIPIVCALLEAGAEIMVEGSEGRPSSPILDAALSLFGLARSEDFEYSLYLPFPASLKILNSIGSSSEAYELEDGRFMQSESVEEVLTSGPGAVIRLLLQSRPELHANDTRFAVLLQMAAAAGYDGYVRLLIERGADLNYPGLYYGSALTAAARFGQSSCVQLLIQSGAEVNTLKGRHGTPLQAAVRSLHVEAVRILVGNGADPNMRQSPYGSPVQLATESGNSAIRELLVDPETKAEYGRAQRTHRPNLACLLECLKPSRAKRSTRMSDP
jgi:ankyrin repeat protein